MDKAHKLLVHNIDLHSIGNGGEDGNVGIQQLRICSHRSKSLLGRFLGKAVIYVHLPLWVVSAVIIFFATLLYCGLIDARAEQAYKDALVIGHIEALTNIYTPLPALAVIHTVGKPEGADKAI